MKKLTLTVAAFSLAFAFTACSDDSSSSSTSAAGNGGSGSGKACLNTFTDGEIRCFTGSSAELLCGGTSTDVESSVLVDGCPENPTATCPDYAGDGVTYFYKEGADCHSF